MSAFHWQFLLGSLVAAVCIGWPRRHAIKFERALWLVWGYFMVSALLASNVDWIPIEGGDVLYTGSSSAKAACLLLLVPIFVGSFMERGRHRLYLFLAGLMTLDALVVIVRALTGSRFEDPRGLFGASSFDAAMIAAVLLPLGVKRLMEGGGKVWALVVPIVLLTAFVTRGSTVWFVLATFTLVCSIALQTRVRLSLVHLGAAGLLLAGAFNASGGLFHTSGRLIEWSNLLTFWWKGGSWLLGTGVGTFEWLGPAIDTMLFGKTTGAFMWMHNDWLQLLFEGGVLGFLGVVTIAGWMLWRARRKPWLVAGLASMGVCMLAQMPLHFFVGQVWLTMLVIESSEAG